VSASGIVIAGAGPAGASAAIAARLAGSPVRLVERTAKARHKVCGEFISPGAADTLETLGVLPQFLALEPCRIRRCVLHLGSRSKQWRLTENAWGMSRFRLDSLLVDRAAALGVVVSRGEVFRASGGDDRRPLVYACGRSANPAQGERLFGFKSHFEGPVDDTVELFFDSAGYAGVSGIENGLTNVCGIASESFLRSRGFDFDQVMGRSAPLAERLKPMRRRMPWVVVGPVSFSAPTGSSAPPGSYPAGDSLGFIDPFTGTGIWNALMTGRLAGISAARGIPPAEYLGSCEKMLSSVFEAASIIRALIAHTELHWLLPLVPGGLLFRLTRARRRTASGGSI
jgi:flavin-dependent dehydrogenase